MPSSRRFGRARKQTSRVPRGRCLLIDNGTVRGLSGKAIVPLRLDNSTLYGWSKDKLGPLQHVALDRKDRDLRWWPQLLVALRHARTAPRAGSL